MKKLLTGNWIIFIIGIAFMISTALAIRNNYIIENNHLTQEQADLIKQRTRDILTQTMHGLDLGVRGFGLTRDQQLLIPYNEAIRETSANLASIDSLLRKQNYTEREKLQDVKREIDNYVAFSKTMIAMAEAGDMEQFAAMLKEDRGYDVWSKYAEFANPLFEYEDRLKSESLKDYQDAIKSNLVIQIAILILVMPMLFMFVTKVNTERKKREQMQKEVDRTDRTFVYNAGVVNADQDVNQRAIEHVKRASEFIASIASGNYNVEWTGMTSDNLELNKQTLAGNLVNLRDRLKIVKEEDERRNWANEGLARFSEIVRNNQQKQEELAIKCISFLTKYIAAQQGSLFTIEEGEKGERFLNLAGCYAFDRRKWIQKRVEIGSGLVGQAYLEGETLFLKEVPKGYTTITSGLGDATPSCIVIVPMKHEDETVAVAEFATFQVLEKYQIAFLEKAGAYLASAIISTRTTLKMKTLLTEASTRELEMRQREEELRQNMEELQATQEELLRKSSEQEYLSKSA